LSIWKDEIHLANVVITATAPQGGQFRKSVGAPRAIRLEAISVIDATEDLHAMSTSDQVR
jgi:hypothetical protein